MHPEVTLNDARSFIKLAKIDIDPITREMKYLDSMLCFVLSGHLMEKDRTKERAVIKFYNKTVRLIK